MKLYATTTSERASKGQGGNQYIVTTFKVGDSKKQKVVLDVKLDISSSGNRYNLIVKKNNEIILMENEEIDTKGKQKKGESDLDPWLACENHSHYESNCSLCRKLNKV